jgi:hypothetical protein
MKYYADYRQRILWDLYNKFTVITKTESVFYFNNLRFCRRNDLLRSFGVPGYGAQWTALFIPLISIRRRSSILTTGQSLCCLKVLGIHIHYLLKFIYAQQVQIRIMLVCAKSSEITRVLIFLHQHLFLQDQHP